jgi:uncharacterized membrane-anchored protein YitT (DUF2179 family)
MLKKEIKNVIFLVLGSFVLAVGVCQFLLPNSITTGGTPGAAILIHYFTGFSTGLVMLLINLPLLALGFRQLGRSFAFRTIGTILISSLFVDLLSVYLNWPALTNQTLLAAIFGGGFIGLGVGLIFKGNSSAGGSTIIAKLIASKTELRESQILLGLDCLIILCSIYIFKDVEKTMWSLMSIYVTSRCVDMILTSGPSKKVVHIVSEKIDQLSPLIVEKLGREGTVISGDALHECTSKTMIFIVVELKKLNVLRDIIKTHDPKAFMIVMEASEMLGRGN